MERAHELARPYLDREGVIGVYLVGSATRPFRDDWSDYDIEVVVTDDAYASTPDEEKHVFVIDEGPPRKVDHEFYLRPWSQFEALVDCLQDVVRYGYQHAEILHDPDGKVAKVVKKLQDLPGLYRHERMRVHWLELVFGIGRAKKTIDRDRDQVLDLKLILADALLAAVKLLFVVAGSWPSSRHWSREELYLLGVPEATLEALDAAAGSTDLEVWKTLVDEVRGFLKSERQTFHEDAAALNRWAFLEDEGKAAFARWAR